MTPARLPAASSTGSCEKLRSRACRNTSTMEVCGVTASTQTMGTITSRTGVAHISKTPADHLALFH